jgi:hypothetical protein
VERECHWESAITQHGWTTRQQLFLRKRLGHFPTTFGVTAAAYAA